MGWDASQESPAHEFSAAGTVRQPQDTQSPLRPSTIISGPVLAAEDGGDVQPPDLPDGLFAEDGDDDEELHQPQGNDENGLVDSKPIEGEECQPQRVLKDPGMPSQKDIDEHEAGGHANYRSWCEACVEGRGVGEPHLGDTSQESKIPILAFDYLFVASGDVLKTREEISPQERGECTLKILVAIDTTSGSIFSLQSRSGKERC